MHTISLDVQQMHTTIRSFLLGLFHSAISQSGAALVPWSVVPVQLAINRTHALAKLTNCPAASTVELLNCLKKIQAKTLVELQPKFHVSFQRPII